MRDKDTSALREVFQCSSLAEKPFYQWDKSTHGLVKITYSGDNWWCPLHCQVHLCKKNNLTITSQELLNKRESNNLHDELNYFTWFANNCQSCWKDDLIVYHNTYCLWQGQRQGPLQYHQQLLLHRSGELFFLILLYSFVCYFLFFMFIYLYNLQYLSVITIQSSGIRWIMG